MKDLILRPTVLLMAASYIGAAPIAEAASQYKKISSCGSAKVISGDTCSNVKVELNFDKCENKINTQLAKKIICEKNTIKARYQNETHRYEARFKKSDDSWGGITWTALTEGLDQFAKNTPPATPTVAAAPAPTPVATTTPDLPKTETTPTERQPTADQGPMASLSASSFFDFRSVHFNAENGSAVNENEKQGYLLEDAAVYLKYTKNEFEGFVDLAFSRNSSSSTDNSVLNFANGKSQVFMSYAMTENLKFVFGQFDTIFGFELNDSKDRVFGNTGIVYNQTLPVVHSGALLQYSANGFTGKILSANPSDRDTLGSNSTDSSYETGITLGYSNAYIRGQVGYLNRPQKNLADQNSEKSLLDVLLGATFFEVLDLDLEYAVVKNPQKNTLTTDAADQEKNGTGVFALLTYRASEKFKIGYRFENTNNDPGAVNYYKAVSHGVALNYMMNQNLTTRLEWVGIDTDRRDAFTSDVYGDSRFDIGAVVNF